MTDFIRPEEGLVEQIKSGVPFWRAGVDMVYVPEPTGNGTVKPVDFQEEAKSALLLYLNRAAPASVMAYYLGALPLNKNDIFVVWFTKTLQNWKALLSTTLDEGMYYELTYNGDKHELYVDAYKKLDNSVMLRATQAS